MDTHVSWTPSSLKGPEYHLAASEPCYRTNGKENTLTWAQTKNKNTVTLSSDCSFTNFFVFN